MTTGALQHLLMRLRRWYTVRTLRSRLTNLSLLIDTMSEDVAQDVALLVDLRAERQQVQRRLSLIERSALATHGRPASEG